MVMSNWEDQALCVGRLELFFPDTDEDGNEIGPTDEAREICAGCPVKSDCLDYAIKNRVEYGIAGGMNHRERESLRMFTYRHTKRTGFEDAVDEVLVNIG